METNAQNNITNDIQETTGTYKDLETNASSGKRIGTWGSIWGILKDQVELIAYIDERINELVAKNAITEVLSIENTDVDDIIDTKEETQTNTEVQKNVSKTTKKKRIVIVG